MKRLVTTPIYYVNDVPHIGHAYTTMICDMLKKHYTLRGFDTFMLTGTDENGQKVEQTAKSKGYEPQDYVDKISGKFKSTWDEFDIEYDKFIRTTDLEHSLSVQKAFEIMYKNGDIYKGYYEGLYCVSCESFYTRTQVLDGCLCPDCKKETSSIKEESYFFRLSNYQDRLLDWYEQEGCILPVGKKNETVSFVRDGLNDLSISRVNFKWGISLPNCVNDDRHVVYVWLDALLNYVSSLGYCLDYPGALDALTSKPLSSFASDSRRLPALESRMEYFFNTTHVVGKDILRFHAVYWPAFLMSLGLPLPKILVHGWWTIDGVKMSKSIGNVVDPLDIKRKYKEWGSDALRFFLLREVPFGEDGDFSETALDSRIDSQLCNDLGNLVSRLAGMCDKYFCGERIDGLNLDIFKAEISKVDEIVDKSIQLFDGAHFNRHVDTAWEIVTMANVLITRVEPWRLAKMGETASCKGFLNLICNLVLKASMLLYPIIPSSCKKISKTLDFAITPDSFRRYIIEGGYKGSFTVSNVESKLFLKSSEIKGT